MSKRILAVILTTAVILSATACNTDSTSSAGTSGNTSVTESSASSDTTESSDDSSETTTESKEESSVVEDTPYTLGGELTPAMIANSRLNEGNKVRLANFLKKAQNGEDVTVGFIGGSITQGTSAGDQLCYAKLTADWIQKLCPQSKVTYVNAGIGATGSYIGVHRVNEDLLSKKPDLVFVEFSVNDTTEHTERNKESYDSLLRTIWNSESTPAIITIATTQDSGISFQDQHLEIVKKYDLPMISYRNTILDVIDKGYIKWTDISGDNIHPDVEGHYILSQLLQAYITDVAANLDSITGEESDFSEKATNAGFENGSLIGPASENAPENNGFIVKQSYWGGFDQMWIASGNDKKPLDASLQFTVEAKSIGIFYGKLINNATTAEIYVDDVLIKTINGDFTGGWGSYVECEHIISYDEVGTHTVKIVPKAKEGSCAFYVNRLAIS